MIERTTIDILQRYLSEQKILPLFYHDDINVCIHAVDSCYKAGCRVFEFTNRGVSAYENFITLHQMLPGRWPSLILGVGTIQSVSDAQKFYDAGADFLISPFMDINIGQYCQQNTIPFIPGCMTPTEIHHAQEVGCSVVKIFPASVVTRDFVRAVKDVFPGVKYVVTGGVAATPESIAHWVDQDVLAIGGGSQLFKKEWINSGQWSELTKYLKDLYTAIRQ